jgi:DNA (cytosine-5)-methyltransferase 1
MKILNLYAGIGGNRKLWGNEHEITAVEINPEIAKIYQDFFPNDKVIVTDAHQYLLEHFEEYDFIWSSPPCPSHSFVRKITYQQNKPIFPDMKLYEEILFLQGYFKGKYVVENVIGWYDPLVKPQEISNHYFWSNFKITELPTIQQKGREHNSHNDILQERKGFDLSGYKLKEDKKKLLRNCVEPETGLHIFNCAFKIKQRNVGDFLSPTGESLIAINQNQKTIG